MVDFLQFGNENIHATLTCFCEEVLRGEYTETQTDFNKVVKGL